MVVCSTRHRYLRLSQQLFPIIAQVLSRGVRRPLELSGIGERELEIIDGWRRHDGRRVDWDWRRIMYRLRKRPKRVEVSFYCEGILCGLMVACISRGRLSVNIRYIEANPDPAHPLKRHFLQVTLYQAELFARFAGCRRVTVSRPEPALLRAYETFAYEMLISDRKRVARGVAPRFAMLSKDIVPLDFDAPETVE